jgi:hypothetical protein
METERWTKLQDLGTSPSPSTKAQGDREDGEGPQHEHVEAQEHGVVGQRFFILEFIFCFFKRMLTVEEFQIW